MKKLNLQMFTASGTVTVYKDAHMTTASASPNSEVAKDDEVTLTLTPASGYEVDEVEVIAGGVEINMTTKKFTFGTDNVVLYVKSKKSTMYKVLEPCYVCINGGSVTRLNKNTKLVHAANGAIVDVQTSGTDLASLNADALAALIASGAVVKI